MTQELEHPRRKTGAEMGLVVSLAVTLAGLAFNANAQPALAMAVDAGLAGAQAAWDLFAAHSGQIDYTHGVTYGIVPRGV